MPVLLDLALSSQLYHLIAEFVSLSIPNWAGIVSISAIVGKHCFDVADMSTSMPFGMLSGSFCLDSN